MLLRSGVSVLASWATRSDTLGSFLIKKGSTYMTPIFWDDLYLMLMPSPNIWHCFVVIFSGEKFILVGSATSDFKPGPISNLKKLLGSCYNHSIGDIDAEF
jgi:hypothetical protein